MKFAPPDDDFEIYKTVFGEDLLGRNKVSKRISGIVDNIEDPLVISLDGKWGTGKSFFLKRWVGAHRNQNDGKALTVYFDAFESDYIADPLPALVASLAARAPKEDTDKLKRIKKAAFRFIKPAARIGLAMATFGATEALSDIGDAAVEALGSEAKGAVDSFWEKEEGRQQAMSDFKSALISLTKGEEEGEIIPVVIVVDELDRCRPDYALEVLETVKHFFSVPHVHFILGVNLRALENSVKVRYGSDIDAMSYLQKFISFSVSLPDHVGDHKRTSATVKYFKHLSNIMGAPGNLSEELESQIRSISRKNNVSMREVGKIVSLSNLMPESVKSGRVFPGWNMVLSTLLITKFVRPDLFGKFIDASLSAYELIEYFDARDLYIDQNYIGRRSEDTYDHSLFVSISCWKFVLSDGADKDANGYDIGKMFSQFGDIHRPREIPRKINEDWLSEISIA